ncbi:non-ribosomal peptide synthetase [Micromonospora okii]|uniref:non-ribosomal peptide synthetase n=1 Tax=Micromonospora okii TaxID=1182970 RepID=UPI001E29CF13|nr:non-ribosomal peptide synthetase [Micromonospora okii]
MTAAPITELLHELRRRRVTLTVEGADLRCSAPPGTLTEDLVARLRVNKTQLLEALRADGEDTVLSYAQERIWLQAALEPTDNAYNLPLRIDLDGALHPAALRDALCVVVRRHEVLRTVYPTRRGRPVPLVLQARPVPLPLVDLVALSDVDRAAAVAAVETAQARRPFDLGTGPLVRALLVRGEPGRHHLLLTRHHIASDGWSLGVLLDELSEVYRARVEGRPYRLPHDPPRYAAYAAAQRSYAVTEQAGQRLARWAGHFRDARFDLDLLAEPAAATPRLPAGSERIVLPAPLVDRARALARQAGTTFFAVLLAAYGTALHRICGQDDIVIGSPFSGRTSPRLSAAVGTFATVLPLRLTLSGCPSFQDVIRRAHEELRLAQQHQDLPTERLVELLRPYRTLADNPLFAAVFALQNTPWPEVRLPGLRAAVVASPPVMPKFALALTATERDGGVELHLEYDRHRLPAPTARQVLDLTCAVLRDVDRPAGEPRSPSGADPTDAEQCLHRLTEEVAAQRPDAVAATYLGAHLSYRALNLRARRLAARLRAAGAGPETSVVLCLEPSLDLIIAALAILKTGAAYVPVDPLDPAARRTRICASSGARIGVARPGLLPQCLTLVPPEDHGVGRPGAAAAGPPVVAENLAYVVHTSGSGGVPKGVMVTHRSITGLLAGARAALTELAGPAQDGSDGPAPVWSMTHSPAFDVSVFEMWGALTSGARLVVAPAGLARTPDELAEHLMAEQVNVLSQTPGAFGELVPVLLRGGVTGSLRTVLLAGERCDVGRFDRWFATFGDRRPNLVNLYGITETTVHAMVRVLRAADARAGISPLGVALPGQRVEVRGPHGQPVPVGGRGEMTVAGVGLSRGYLGLPGRTAERFVPDDRGLPGGRRYLSGDLAAVASVTDLAYLGRTDAQIKLRGHRVELAEIEAELARHPDVRGAVVVPRSTGTRTYLIGYVLPEDGSAGFDESALRHWLGQRLPRHLVPARLAPLPALPLTRNGKVDRAALVDRARELPASVTAQPPTSPTERALVALLTELLGDVPAESIGIHDDLFDLGADSLLITQLHARIVEMFDVEPPVRRVYRALDLASIALVVDELRTERETEAVRRALAEATGTDSPEDAWRE